MKILYNVFNTKKGTYWRAFHLAKRLADLGNELTFIYTSDSNRFSLKVSRDDNITIVEAPDLFHGSLRSGWDIWNIINRIRFIRKENYDICHAFESRPVSIYPALTAKRRGAKLIIDWADWFGKGGSVEERSNPVIRFLLRKIESYYEIFPKKSADGLTVICSALEEKAKEIGFDHQRIHLLRNGSNLEGLERISKEQARQKLGILQDLFIIGYTGALFKNDAHLMYAAFEKFKSLVPNSLLYILGKSNWDQLIKNNTEHIQTTGSLRLSELNHHLSACDVFWLPLNDSPANQGRLPMKLMDYIYVDRPIVATQVGDIPVILGKDHSLICQPDPHEIASKTKSIIDQEKVDIYLPERNDYFKNEYNWKILGKGLNDFYSEILNG